MAHTENDSVQLFHSKPRLYFLVQYGTTLGRQRHELLDVLSESAFKQMGSQHGTED